MKYLVMNMDQKLRVTKSLYDGLTKEQIYEYWETGSFVLRVEENMSVSIKENLVTLRVKK